MASHNPRPPAYLRHTGPPGPLSANQHRRATPYLSVPPALPGALLGGRKVPVSFDVPECPRGERDPSALGLPGRGGGREAHTLVLGPVPGPPPGLSPGPSSAPLLPSGPAGPPSAPWGPAFSGSFLRPSPAHRGPAFRGAGRTGGKGISVRGTACADAQRWGSSTCARNCEGVCDRTWAAGGGRGAGAHEAPRLWGCFLRSLCRLPQQHPSG